MANHEHYMRRCLQLAALGRGYVAPNPMVGAVIVCRDEIIGEGFHRVFGGPHAEVHAIESVKDKALLKESTIYVTLEPCSHFGKTPPCADLIIRSGIPRVVIGSLDINPLVAGNGVRKLIDAGVEVVHGICSNECDALNVRFVTFHQHKRPYIILKWAQTPSGWMDVKRPDSDPVGINWISDPATKSLVHQWRAEEQAIMIGAGTLANDNPSLTVREVQGKNPIRIVLAGHKPLYEQQSIFSDDAETILILPNDRSVSELNWLPAQSNVRAFNLNSSPTEMASLLYDLKIQSVIVEGGASVLTSFIQSGLWDEARVITGVNDWRDGLAAPLLPMNKLHSSNSWGKDTIQFYFNK